MSAVYANHLVLAELVINELYPAPSTGETEWVELFNNENSVIDITNYSLSDLSNNKIKIATTSANPYEYIITTSTNVLNNTGDTIFLKNALTEVIDIATYSGTFTTEKTWTRCPDGFGSWFALNTTSKQSSNETACAVLTPTPTPTLLPTTTPTPTTIPTPTNQHSASSVPNATPTQVISSTPTSLSPTPTPVPTIIINNIYLSEIMASPNAGENEWVELYNDNDYSVTLENWAIDDQVGAGATPFHFSLTISAHEYNSINLAKTMFNNDGDQVNLYNSNDTLQDSFEYQKSGKNISLGRMSWENDDYCEQTPSKNLPNNNCITDTTTLTSITHIPTPIPTIKTVKNSTNITSSIKPQTSYISPSIISNGRLPIHITHPVNYNSNVLGLTSTYSMPKKYPLIINYLNFISFSYSFLTIGGILAKIKRWS